MKRMKKVQCASDSSSVWTIDKLYRHAYEIALYNVAKLVNRCNQKQFSFRDNAVELEQLAQMLEIKFNENGDII